LAIETDVFDVSMTPVLPYRYLTFYSVHDDSPPSSRSKSRRA